LNSSTVVHFFVGNIPADQKTWATADAYAGAHAIFLAPGMSMVEHLSRGQVAITHTLLSHISSPDQKRVIPFLQKKLRWRAVDSKGNVIGLEALKDSQAIKVDVASRQVTQTAQDNEFPIYGPWEIQNGSVLGNLGDKVLPR
jgi:hypothetical protein